MQAINASPRTGVGSREDFERLFREEYPRVVGIANRVLADRQAAEDVAQEVFVDFNRLHRADAPYAGPWLHAAAAHRALNAIRSRLRRAKREAAYPAPAPADPAEEVERAEERRLVRAALARMPGRGATVLALRYSGLSYSEVAGALGVGVNQVGTLLRRAEAQLRREVERGTSR